MDDATTYTREELTFNDHVNAAIDIARVARGESRLMSRDPLTVAPEVGAMHNDAARDLSLSITNLEDALTRYNSARYRQAGMWDRADSDKVITAKEAKENEA